jgi:hypothetical protein
MSDISTMAENPPPGSQRTVWHGAAGLAKVLGVSERRAAWLLENRLVPCTKLRGRYIGTVEQVLDFIEKQAAQQS